MRFNLIYLLLIIGVLIFVPFARQLNQHPVEFYGIAETEERAINLEYAIVIQTMDVVLGQKVEQGQLLAKLHRTSLPIKMNDINYELKELDSKKGISDLRLNTDIEKLQGDKRLIETEYKNKIAQLQLEKSNREKILEGVKTIDLKVSHTELDQKISDLQTELQKRVDPLNVEIANLQKDISASRNLVNVRIKKLRQELDLIQEQEDALHLKAPMSGIIGQLNYQKGENVEAYSNLMKIYGERPNIVTTYVADGQLAQIEMGDTLSIASINAPNYQVEGLVIGLGTRITSLPERLRKIPEIKAWGREVQVRIPSSNNFMQGERVLVKMDELETTNALFGSLF